MSRLFENVRGTRGTALTGFARFHRTPGPGLDPGPTASSTARGDDRIITVWENRRASDATDYHLTNKPIGDTYSTVEFGVTKRMSDNWQLISGFDWTKRNLSSLFSEDPTWCSKLEQHADDGLDDQGGGKPVFKKGIMVGLSYRGHEGRALRPLFHRH